MTDTRSAKADPTSLLRRRRRRGRGGGRRHFLDLDRVLHRRNARRRGVACGETIRNLMEKHLVKIAGRAEEPDRPILYGTTKRFLELFGLNSLKDLPQSEELTKPKA